MTESGVSAMRRVLGAVATTLLAANLVGCSSVSEQTVSSTLVTPGKYEFYACPEIQNSIRSHRFRQTELEMLMAKASQGFGGEFVSAIAYRSEYLQTRGEIEVLVRAEEEKQCAARSPWSSERALF